MRTTLTIEDRLAEELKQAAQASGKPFKQVVNEALRAGLKELNQPRPRRYRLQPASMGDVRPDIDLRKALALADELENEQVAEELERRK